MNIKFPCSAVWEKASATNSCKGHADGEQELDEVVCNV